LVRCSFKRYSVANGFQKKSPRKELDVNINKINKMDQDYLVNNLKELPREKEPSAAPALSTLAHVTDKAGLSALTPKLQNILQAIDNPEGNVLQAISNNISSLQDAFVAALAGTLEAAGIDVSHKITLRLNQTEALTAAGEHPDKERLEKVLGQNRELAAAFKEISSQSEVLRDVDNIGKVIGLSAGISGYQNSARLAQNTTYQISLKGEMSHFYFSNIGAEV
jgi:hypothetical protein